ncbi:protein of unknown function [Acidithiobacillus ferrivorans]|uniref:Uncharacterized protein n=1 Tax=Acidithiobacillus ferrivorans TaxID=160808 RepID=A0A060UXK6_9PROT|nr:hypothetical protein [Acidithiobacillus ferrivorans]CDQ11254.1 hypothetical protein AFERRI_530149 [Acidithiobacillus ferrivorans]SMH67615.1 protein of unknown function [Acidithiobacillus ferrivorans]
MSNIFDSFDEPFVTTVPAPTGRVFSVTVSESIKTDDLDGQTMPGHTWALKHRRKPRKLTPATLEQFHQDLQQAILDGVWALSPQFHGPLRSGAGKQGLGSVSANLDALFDLCRSSPTSRVRDQSDDAMRAWQNVCQTHGVLSERAKYAKVPDREITDWYRASMVVVDPITSLAAFASLEGCRLGED